VDGLSAIWDGLCQNLDGLSAIWDGLCQNLDGLSAIWGGLCQNLDELSAISDGVRQNVDGLSGSADDKPRTSIDLPETIARLYPSGTSVLSLPFRCLLCRAGPRRPVSHIPRPLVRIAPSGIIAPPAYRQGASMVSSNPVG